MRGAVFGISEDWHIPKQVRRLSAGEEVSACCWELLAFSRAGCAAMADHVARCRVLLIPGDCCLHRVRAETVITYGLSPRDSITLSGITRPVLCVQRILPGVGGTDIEPQEIPLAAAADPEELLLRGALDLLCGNGETGTKP